jgi:hypothetical protein
MFPEVHLKKIVSWPRVSTMKGRDEKGKGLKIHKSG